jgi:dTDP-4-amino-4,6-dideoxygalactose transaminase
MSAVAAQPLVPLHDVRLTADDRAAVEDCLRSGWLAMGPRTEAFERAFAEHLGARHAVAVASGTAALHLAYLAAGVGPGDEVVVPAFTFVATAAAVRQCGATAVLADVCGSHDLGVDPADVARRITRRTRAVTVVHYAGYPAAVEAVRALCEEHGLALIEDAAHAPCASSRVEGRPLGTLGTAGAFSFFANKILSCGEGGLLATDDDAVAEDARRRRSHAMSSGTWERHLGRAAAYDVAGLGFNYRIDEPRAALLLARLGRLAADVAGRRRGAHRYRALLADVPGITVPYADADVDRSSCYVMPVLVDDARLRDPLRAWLRERAGVQASVLYPAIHELTAYRPATAAGLRRTEAVARSVLALPLYAHLGAERQDRVVAGLRDGLRELGR